MNCMLSLDQSTAQSKLLLIDAQGSVLKRMQKAHRSVYPQPGWAQQDAEEIWQNVLELLQKMLEDCQREKRKVAGFALTNQRETVVVWDRKDGRPLAPAVGWQCQRAASLCQKLSAHSQTIQGKTGLLLSPYYSAAKAAWLLEHDAALRSLARQGRLCIGTIDSYLLFRLTGGAVFATDASNASRTQLFDLKKQTWDESLCDWFGISPSSLGQVVASDADLGLTAKGLLPSRLRLSGILGDSHAAMLAQGCLKEGDCKATYGTGSSIMMHAGTLPPRPPSGLSVSVAWRIGSQTEYVVEGNVTSSGDTLRWLCEDLGLVDSLEELNELAASVPDAGGVFLVPAFAGLGAPYFDSQAKAAILGMQRNTSKAHVARAALESIALQNASIIHSMKRKIRQLHANGGASQSQLLMQIQAELIQTPVIVSQERELSALGAAYLGGLKLGFFDCLDDLIARRQREAYTPKAPPAAAKSLMQGWEEAVRKVRSDAIQP